MGTETYVAGRERQAPLRALIHVSGVEAKPEQLRWEQGVCTVGSGSHNDIVIDDKAVSRSHLELELVPEGVMVRDLRSRNGTFFDGHRLERMTLAFGSSLRVGRAMLSIGLDRTSIETGQDFEGDRYMGMLGASSAMRSMFATLERLRGSLVTVLVQGESGVGKELVARGVHRGSRVADGPFVALNCGALTRELVGSELFGHQRGAFTGASGPRKGAFGAADGGTLFLDEVGELPLEVQPALLRALEVGEVRAVGSDSARTVKTRVVAATNRDLTRDVAAGKFRQDLYYRLAVIKIVVPPLRDRPEDVALLADHFATELGAEPLARDVRNALQARAWPGNVRELKNAVHAYTVLGVLPQVEGGGGVDAALEQWAAQDAPYAQLKEELVDRFTSAYLRTLLARAGGNQSTAAKMAGLDRSYLGRLLSKYATDKS